MKSLTIMLLSFTVLMSSFTCKKGDSNSTNITIEGLWSNSAWGGVNNNPIVIDVNLTAGNAIITVLGSQRFGYEAGETLLSNIKPATGGTYTCNAMYKYGTNNSQTGNTTAVIKLISNNQQLSVLYASINGAPQIEYIYSKE